jgi:RNA polymerase sigma-70 factor (ECF subfamily)
LLPDDVWLTMPPYPYQYQGAAAIGNFLRVRGARHDTPLRLVATRANGQPGFGCYFPCPETEIARAYGLLVLTLAGTKIAEITFFADTSALPHFGLPRSVPSSADEPTQVSAGSRDRFFGAPGKAQESPGALMRSRCARA